MRCSSPSLSWTGTWIVSLAGFFTGRLVEGHIYLMQPISRNFFYTTAFQTYGFEDMTYCPHCLQSKGPDAVRARAEANTPAGLLSSYGDGAWPLKVVYDKDELASNGNYLEPEDIAVRHGICGDPEQTAAEGHNVFGQENSVYPVIETYEAGAVIEMKTIVATYDWGHLEFFICNSEDLSGDGEDSKVTQGCFNMNPLTRAEDDGDASPIDPNHPGRYYLDPPCRVEETDQTILDGAFGGYVVTSRYQLPEGLTCERCIVQMVYYTGNLCHHPGYEEFSPPSWPSCATTEDSWITLDPPMCGEGDAYPEEFWNCADIAITSDERGPSTDDDDVPTINPEPTLASTTAEPEPIAQPESETSSTTTKLKAEYSSRTRTLMSEPTIAPYSMSTTTSGDETCSDPAGGWQQCGGHGWEGSTCCRPGYQCDELAYRYSQCRPVEEECSWLWEQCGGQDWDGPVCCSSGTSCTVRNMWHSQCTPIAQ